MKTKKCTKCKQVKPLDEFHRASNTKDGRRARCAKCQCEIKNAKYAANEKCPEKKRREAIEAANPGHRVCAKCDELKLQSEFDDGRAVCKKCRQEYAKRHRQKPEVRQALRDYENTPAQKQRRAKYQRERRANDPFYKAMCLIRSNIGASFTRSGVRKPKKALAVLGVATWAEAIAHLGPYKPGTEVDHIIPVSLAKHGNIAELMALNSLWNLRRIPKSQNRKKHAKLPEPHELDVRLPRLAVDIYARAKYPHLYK